MRNDLFEPTGEMQYECRGHQPPTPNFAKGETRRTAEADAPRFQKNRLTGRLHRRFMALTSRLARGYVLVFFIGLPQQVGGLCSDDAFMVLPHFSQ